LNIQPAAKGKLKIIILYLASRCVIMYKIYRLSVKTHTHTTHTHKHTHTHTHNYIIWQLDSCVLKRDMFRTIYIYICHTRLISEVYIVKGSSFD